ncbi:MAG: bacillithiol system protein YtxJ, partial [Flavobacteriales bacterium]
DSKMKLYFLDLLSNRNISNEIGSEFQVFHQSPQLIVIKNGEAVYHASHNDIQAGNLKRFI